VVQRQGQSPIRRNSSECTRNWHAREGSRGRWPIEEGRFLSDLCSYDVAVSAGTLMVSLAVTDTLKNRTSCSAHVLFRAALLAFAPKCY
jgi:hypothetical protein